MANERTHLLSIYAPDVRKPKEEREAFFDALQATLDKITSKDKVFIMGDFNSRIGNTVIPGIMHSFNEEAVNDNGDILIDVCTLNELRINNTYFDHKEQQKYTFANTRGQKSTIDYIITNRKVHPSQILDVRVLTSANIGTQHGLVLCKYHVSHIIKKRKTPNYVSKFNIESLKDESIKYLYQNRLREKIVQNPIKETDNVEAAWEKLKNKIKNSAKESLGKRTIDTNRTHNKPWFTLEIKELANEKKKAYIKYITNRTQEEYEVYKRVRNRTTNTIKELKKTYWENFSVEMEHDLYGGQKKIWNMIRKRKKPINEEVVINFINQETWAAHFEIIYDNNGSRDEEEIANPPSPNEQEETITLEEVQTTIKKLKNRKSPDLKQAFDRVKLNDKIHRLNQKGVKKHYTNLVRQLNINTKARIKTDCGLTRELKVSSGIRQGDSLSPCLFNVIMDQIIESVNEVNAGFEMNNRHLRIHCYADDAILIAENEDDLQRLLHKFNLTAQRLNMQISCEKTQSMIVKSVTITS
ncbi:uncharacterized protein LOC130902950 [Diorhabda carinulata]|uniref:uncharacterized protein LOC130902950 n=1 Tax=Diorhabda carinulata TaxID=1163345 RepID=UPI0025A1349F|nr:uncharacterized protein LOC130902950 [Diorhabda carinulata]